MSGSRFEEMYPVLGPVARRIGRALARVSLAICGGVASIAKRTWKPALVVLLLLAVVHGVATFIYGRQVDAEIARIRASGGPVSVAELAGPSIPDDQNAAVICEKAFILLGSGKQPSEAERDAMSAILKPDERRKHPEAWDRARSAVKQFDGVLPLIEQAMSRPKCRFPVRWQDGWFANFNHLGGLWRLQRYLAAKAVITAHDGDMAGAIHLIGLQIRLSETACNEPAPISQLVRYTMIRSAVNSLQYVLGSGAVSPGQARQLSRSLSEIDLMPGLMAALKGDRALGGLIGFQSGRASLAELRNIGFTCRVRYAPYLLMCEASAVGKPFRNADQAAYLRAMNEVIRICELPYQEFESKWESMVYVRGFPWYASVTNMIIPMLEDCLRSRYQAQARVALAQAGLDLLDYHARSGSYPASLSDLATGLGRRVNVRDPFSGSDFIYKPQANGYVLYSVGQNVKDDGGRERREDNSNMEDDIVWKIDR